MEKRVTSEVMLALLLTSMLTLVVSIQPVKASGTIYIRADGSVEGTDKIQRDGDVYTFTDNIYESIVVQKDNIVIDGAGYTLQGPGSGNGNGFYWIEENNVTIKNTEIKAFSTGIGGDKTANNCIVGNNITANTWYGIALTWPSNNKLIENKAINNRYCIRLTYNGKNNTISGNNITNNRYDGYGYGIRLDSECNNNTISGNNITNNDNGIVLSFNCENNTISGNNITNNDGGIDFYSECNNNRFYHNNCIDNIAQVSIFYETNVWDDGYPSGGNYWSDYTGVDANGDGIGDTPYVIDENNQDRYPLMSPWSPRPPSPNEAVNELLETIKTWSLYKGTENSLTSKLQDALHLLGIGNENGATHKLMEFISQVEALRDKKLNSEQADYLISEAQRIIALIKA